MLSLLKKLWPCKPHPRLVKTGLGYLVLQPDGSLPDADDLHAGMHHLIRGPLTAYTARVEVAHLMQSHTGSFEWKRALRWAGGLERFAARLDDDLDDEEIVRFQQDHPDFAGWMGATLLMAAAKNDDAEAVAALAERGGQPLLWARGPDGRTAAHWAASEASPAVAVFLAKATSMTDTDVQGWTPMMTATAAGRAETVEALLPESDLSSVDNDGHAALSLSVLRRPSALPVLLKAEAALREAMTAQIPTRADDTDGSGASAREKQTLRFAWTLLIAAMRRNRDTLTSTLTSLAEITVADEISRARPSEVGESVGRPTRWPTLTESVLVALAFHGLENRGAGLHVKLIELVLARAFEAAERVATTPSVDETSGGASPSAERFEPDVAMVASWRDNAAARVMALCATDDKSELVALDTLLDRGPATPERDELIRKARTQFGPMQLPRAFGFREPV